MTFLVIQAQTDKEIADALSIRNQVFIEEQGVDPKIELDQYDAKQFILLVSESRTDCGGKSSNH